MKVGGHFPTRVQPCNVASQHPRDKSHWCPSNDGIHFGVYSIGYHWGWQSSYQACLQHEKWGSFQISSSTGTQHYWVRSDGRGVKSFHGANIYTGCFQVEFYGGSWAWPMISHISMPLAIFYRYLKFVFVRIKKVSCSAPTGFTPLCACLRYGRKHLSWDHRIQY